MARIRYDADAKSAIKAAKDLARAQEEIAGGANESAKAFGKADAQTRRWLKSAEGPLQKYNRQLLETSELQKRGLITQKQAAQAVEGFRAKVERLDPALKAASEQQRRLTEQGKQITSELETPLERFKGKVLSLGKAYRTGAISQETFVRGSKKLKKELREQDGTVARLKSTEKAQADARKRQLATMVTKQKEAAAAADQLKNQAKAIVRENEQPLERFKRKYKELNRVYKQGAISLGAKRRAARRLRTELRAAGDTGKMAFGDILGSVASLSGSLAGGAGILLTIGKINQAYEVWIANQREISQEAKKAQNEIVAFAALQEDGTKRDRVLAAGNLAAQFGVTDRGQAFNTVQALQSVRKGDIVEGTRSARTVFEASQLGVPVELGRELELLGASQGQEPGQAIRRAFVAGQQSARTPATLATAAPALKFFDDKDTGFAAAGVLAGSVGEGNLQTFVKRAGIALSSVGAAQKKFEKLGLGKATQLERLTKLSDLGVDTAEELKEFGFTEIRSIEALAGLVPNVEEVKRIRGEIVKQAVPGLFSAQRKSLENQLPSAAKSRKIDVLSATFQNETAFGESSGAALDLEVEQKVRGLAFKKLGIEQVFQAVPFFGKGIGLQDAIDQEGRTTLFQQGLLPAHAQKEVAKEMRRINATLEESSAGISRAAEAIEQSSKNNRTQPVTTRAE